MWILRSLQYILIMTPPLPSLYLTRACILLLLEGTHLTNIDTEIQRWPLVTMGLTFYIILDIFLTFCKVHLYDETKDIIELRPLVRIVNLKNKPS